MLRSRPTSADGSKLFADGMGGWEAYAYGGNLFLKRFADQPASAQAPGEGEICIYPGATWLEFEVEGPYTPIRQGRQPRLENAVEDREDPELGQRCGGQRKPAPFRSTAIGAVSARHSRPSANRAKCVSGYGIFATRRLPVRRRLAAEAPSAL